MKEPYLKPENMTKLRSNMYSFLSVIYLNPMDEPHLKLLKEIAESHPANVINERISKQVAAGFKEVNENLMMNNRVAFRTLVKRLSSEFTRLFRGINKFYSPPPPYESVYREGLCFGDSTVKVLEEYHRFNLELGEKSRGEPPDHISFELEFMHLLCEREGEAWRKDSREEALRFLKTEENFLNKHILKWIGEFCENIRRYDRLGFYRGWADVTEGWIIFDYHQIEGYKTILHVY